MIDGALGKGRRRPLAELLQRRLGVGDPQADELPDRRGQVLHTVVLHHPPDGVNLLYGGAGGLLLVGQLGVDLAVHVVAHRLHDALLLHGKRRLVGAGEGEELRDGVAALQVDHVRAAPCHDAGRDVLAGHELHEPLGQRLGFHGDLEVEVAFGIRDEAAAQKGAAQVGRRAAGLGHERFLDTHLEAALGREHPHVAQGVGQMGLGRHLDEVVRCLVQHRTAHGEVRLQRIDAVQKPHDEPC